MKKRTLRSASKAKRRPAKKASARRSPARGASRNGKKPRSRSAKPTKPTVPGALALAMELMAVPGDSGHEQKIIAAIRKKLLAAGAKKTQLTIDETPKHSPLGGETGGLIFKLPGKRGLPRRMLMAHVDTVPLCVGCKPVKRGKLIHSADPATALGADDRAGATVVLNAALAVLKSKGDHPPLTFFWPVQEEVGLYGARYVNFAKLGNPKLAFNFDGGDYQKLTIGATGAYRMTIEIRGIASHAGGAPELGVSAIAIAALAIADLAHGGWHGDIHKNGHHGTSNVGVIRGGEATNVVTDYVEVRAEARSHDAKFRKQIQNEIASAFKRAARQVANIGGKTGKAKITSHLDYESFRLDDDEPCITVAEDAVRAVGGKPLRTIANGGLDANWLSARGIPTVSLGCGQVDIHTVNEQLDIAQFEQACLLALELVQA